MTSKQHVDGGSNTQDRTQGAEAGGGMGGGEGVKGRTGGWGGAEVCPGPEGENSS